MRMMYCGYSFLRRSNFPTTKPHDRLEKFKKWQFHSLFTRSLFCTIFKKRFYSSNILVSGGDPICVSCVFGSLNCSPKMGDFSSFCGTKGLPNGHFCHFLQCCHFLIVFLFCLFVVVVVFLHRIRQHAALVIEGVLSTRMT